MVSDWTNDTAVPPCYSVLILVLMEYGLGRVCSVGGGWGHDVLILVLMECDLGNLKLLRDSVSLNCLNPCFIGIWSRTAA